MASQQRFVINARIIATVLRSTPRLKMFMMSVMWSDEAEVIIYRSFQDFKEFHGQLKKTFPHLNPFRKNDRVIPKFKGRAMRSSLQQKGSKRSVQRMKFLESYCDELLKCDHTVTLSSAVTHFFMPKDHDLQSDFTKNCIMILQSDGSVEGGEGVTRQHAGSITHPFVTQTYSCVAPFETKDTKNRPFKVAVNEKLDVLIKDPAGWWLVGEEDKCLAWFPAPYLELWEGEDDDAGIQLTGDLYCAVKGYSTKKADEVSVPIGSVVEVLRQSDDGWWLVRFNGKAGYFPSMYLKPYNNPRAGLFNMQRKLYNSTVNLASRSFSTGDETNPEGDSTGQPRDGTTVPDPLHKVRSLGDLSQIWSQTKRDVTPSDSRTRSISSTSTGSSFSSFSSSSESSSSLKEEEQHQSCAGQPEASHQPDTSPGLILSDRRGSNSSSGSSGSASSRGSETASVAPKVPPRPKAEEILTRCTTMTRKAALASKARLQVEPESSHSR
nr:NADPH oxidase organizer 1-like isoform X2 [Monopterus albus]